MKSKTLILIHPNHKKTLKNKNLVNQEIELLFKRKKLKNYKYVTYNKIFKKTLKKIFLRKIQLDLLSLLIKILIINKDDLNNIKFLFLQSRNWGFLEIRYSKFLKRYIKYPAFFRYIYLFFACKIQSELLKNWIAQFSSLITVCYYDREILPFVQAFRNQNKKVWDVQHGSITSAHFAYKENLFTLQSKLAPTGFYIYQKNAEQFLKNKKCDVVILKRGKKKNYNRQSNILVTLQWGCKLPKKICNLLTKIKKRKVILRMHPRDHDPLVKKFDDPFFYENIKKSENIVFQTGYEPLNETLDTTYLHFTENCSIVHEAAERGILSFFWCSRFGPEMFQNEIRLGLAKQLKSNADLTKIFADFKL